MLIKSVLYIFIGCASIHFLFWIFWFSKLIFFQNRKQVSNSANEPVSIVICARNELNNLKSLLPKLYQQKYPQYEIIVVNDNSGDGTYDFLREEEPANELLEVVNIHDTPDHINAKKYALMLGIKKAKHDIILLTDADCYPNTDAWIEKMAGAFDKDTQIVLGYSQYERKPGFLNAFIRFETLNTGILYVSAALSKSAYMGVGRNLAYRKSYFLKHNGFSGFEKIMGGDDDLFVNKHANNKNTKVVIGSEAMVYSYPKLKWASYYKQKLRHLAVGKLYKAGSKTRLAILSLAHILFWFSFITLAVMSREPIWLIGGFLIRTLFLLITFVPGAKKLGDKTSFFTLVFLDLFYVGYFIFTGIPALLSKRIKWS